MGKKESHRIVINALLEQYGAAFKALENIIKKCPDHYWEDSMKGPPFYKIIYQTYRYFQGYQLISTF